MLALWLANGEHTDCEHTLQCHAAVQDSTLPECVTAGLPLQWAACED